MSSLNVSGVLSNDENVEVSGKRTHHATIDGEKQAVDSTEQPTTASSTSHRLQKEDETGSSGNEVEKGIAEEQPSSVAYPKGIEALFIMLALVLSITLIALDQTIVATAIPKITDQFDSLNDISWYASAYLMTLGAFQSLWGKVFKYFPLKTSFLVAISIFELGSLISAVAQNSTTLIVGRAISGLGAAGIAPGVYTISAFAAEPTKRATYTGVIGISYGVSAAAGPLIGGGLTGAASWRWCFYINLPVGAVAVLTILLTFKTPPAAKVVDATLKEKILHMDFLGTALTMAATLCLLLALQYGGVTHAWDSSLVIGLLVGFVALVLALITAEIWQGERAMLTPRLMRQRHVWVNSLWGFFLTGPYFITLYYLPIYFQSVDSVSPIASGVRSIPLIAMFSIATYASGRAITKAGIAAPYMAVSSVIVTISAGLFYTLTIGTSTGKWVGYQILAGFGYGIAFQVPVIIAQAFSAPSDIAPTTAIIIFCRGVGGTFLLAAAQSGFVNQLLKRLTSSTPSVDPALVIATGATELHQVFSGSQLDGVIRGYAWGINVAFAITIAACGITLPVSLCSRWDNVNSKKT